MSKYIVIQEGAEGKQFVADKLKTALVGGGNCLWVPEDETELQVLNVTENGTYTPEDFYGYSQVIVSVPGGAGASPGGPGSSVAGTNADGDPAVVEVDDGGALVETVMPVSIEVTTLPTTTTYVNGATIDFTGIVVKAYDKDGNLWTADSGYPGGQIPYNELIFTETTADATKIEGSVWSDDNGINAEYCICNVPCPTPLAWITAYVYPFAIGTYINGEPCSICKMDTPGCTFMTRYNGQLYAAHDEGNTGCDVAVYDTYAGVDTWNWRQAGFQTSSEGVFWQIPNFTAYFTDLPESTVDPTGKSVDGLHMISGGQPIPVQWVRPDGTTLETSFDIHFTSE